eukprot:scaffold41705_cov58-Attheya_sp.AAC.3
MKKDAAPYVEWFENLKREDVERVGGKNSSLGEMVSQLTEIGISVPPGYATTSDAYWHNLAETNLKPIITKEIDLFIEGKKSLSLVGSAIRGAIAHAPTPKDLEREIIAAYIQLGNRVHEKNPSVAVRSSATAEDLPEASFAGQQETFLNVRGEQQLIQACRNCWASLFTDRAIVYRQEHGFDHMKVALSIGIQLMARSDRGASGVMFTIDTETGFPDVCVINSAWGLGENVVKGEVNPDEFVLFKPMLKNSALKPILRKSLGEKEKTMILGRGGPLYTKNINTPKSRRQKFSITDEDAIQLAKWGMIIEDHYSASRGMKTPMDIEWAKDGLSGKLYIVQARPETVQSQVKQGAELISYRVTENNLPKPLVTGRSIGQKIVTGEACVIQTVEEIDQFRPGCILISEITDPDWVPIMKQAIGIVTDHGGRTCHAAIISRELGIPAVVGTGDSTDEIRDGAIITLCCDGGEVGIVYPGKVAYERKSTDLTKIAKSKTKIMLNLADPDSAFRWWKLPIDGIGLARMEFCVMEHVKVHPMALAHPERVQDPEILWQIEEMTKDYETPSDYFVQTLARGIGQLAALAYPNPMILRMSDFKTNEYATLFGGEDFEPKEENPMIGFRGASRYYSPQYQDGFKLECKAVRYARETMGFTNLIVMIPFCRTLEEADKVLEVMAKEGLARSKDFKIYVMCEIPSNVILATQFAKRFDGFSIGSNDLTQLTLGVDRDSENLAHLFDERNEAVLTMIQNCIRDAKAAGSKVGICGQAPSDHPGFAELLVDMGIDSISLNPDSVLGVRQRVAAHEKKIGVSAEAN